MKKERLDKRLVDLGLAAARERARALILAGQVEVNGRAADKAGTPVGEEDEIRLRVEDHPYVSRGALKLVHGLDAFRIDPAGAVALDVGASTGGFTDVLLRRGAHRVYAIDVGYGQLAWTLRQDPRVVVLERENIRHLEAAKIPDTANLAVCDVSFISLELVLPRIASLVAPRSPLVVLVKPQFEVGRRDVGKGGVVRDPEKRLAAVEKIAAFARAQGLAVHGTAESPILGPAGNAEYLMHLETP